jgi:hypothetical protein
VNDAILNQLVGRVSILEETLAKIGTKEAAFGNAACLGGNADVGGVMSTASTSFVDLGGSNYTRKTFTKKAAETDLLVIYHLSGFVSTASTADVGIGVQVDAAAATAGDSMRFNVQNTHLAWSGMVAIAGIGSGDRDVELRCRVGDGADTFETNGADYFAYVVWELPASLTF